MAKLFCPLCFQNKIKKNKYGFYVCQNIPCRFYEWRFKKRYSDKFITKGRPEKIRNKQK